MWIIGMQRGIGLTLAGIGTVLSLGLFWFTSIPLGIPGEWEWLRIPYPAEALPEFWWSLLLLIFAGGVYLTVCLKGAEWIEDGTRPIRMLALFLLCLSGFWWLSSLQETPPAGYAREKVAWVLYYKGSSGYFTEARYEIDNVSEFLAGYEARMAEGDVLHVGTHPPGLFLIYAGAIKLTESSPGLSEWINQRASISMKDALDLIQQHERASPLLVRDRAALILVAQFTQLLAILTILPLYLLISLRYSRLVAWKVCAFWSLVPAVAIFLPKSDLLYPFLGTSFLVVWLSAVKSRSYILAVCSGLIFWCGLFCSLALLPVAVLAVAWTIVVWKESLFGDISVRNVLSLVASSFAGFLLPVVLCWLIVNLPLISVWFWNYRNHAGFYEQFTRTSWKWFLVNPIELLLSLGIPLLFAMVLSLKKGWKKTSSRWFLFSPLLVWALLWLSGKNQGEAARLWVVLMPWFCLMTVEVWNQDPPSNDTRPVKIWSWILMAQMVVCLATVLRVLGFHFSPTG